MILCKNEKCKSYKYCGFAGWQCTQEHIGIDSNGKCLTYVKDTTDNIKRVRDGKYKNKEVR